MRYGNQGNRLHRQCLWSDVQSMSRKCRQTTRTFAAPQKKEKKRKKSLSRQNNAVKTACEPHDGDIRHTCLFGLRVFILMILSHEIDFIIYLFSSYFAGAKYAYALILFGPADCLRDTVQALFFSTTHCSGQNPIRHTIPNHSVSTSFQYQ